MRSVLRRPPGPGRRTQQCFPVIDRSERLRRRFKLVIGCGTVFALAGMIAGTRAGRFGSTWLWDRAKWSVLGAIGLPPDRADIDKEWRLKRAMGIAATERTYRKFYDRTASPAWRKILQAAGMAPADALFRWANYDWTVVLSSEVFEADETGRAYRMRPGRRAFWARNHSLPDGLASFFFLPDTPVVQAAMAEAHEPALPESFQTTNSWGCRGPEPDRTACVRGLILGDSFMQGLFVADDQTPAECLARDLRSTWPVSVSLLNTGHIGYSPEQYHQTLVEYYDRWRPHFIILSVCPNDFGNAVEVLQGKGQWAEGQYWLDQINQFCRTRQVPCLLVPVPFESQVAGRGDQGHYPGGVCNIYQGPASGYLNPVEAFTTEHLRLIKEAMARGKRPATSPLFNGHLEDGHFSPLGCELWAQLVAQRLALIMDAPPQ